MWVIFRNALFTCKIFIMKSPITQCNLKKNRNQQKIWINVFWFLIIGNKIKSSQINRIKIPTSQKNHKYYELILHYYDHRYTD